MAARIAFFANLSYGAAAALYTLAAIVHLLYMFRREFGGWARWSTRSAWLMQTLGLVLLVVQTQRFPVITLFEFAYSFAWLLMTNYVGIEYFRDNQAAGSFVTPVVAVVSVLSVALPKPGQESLILNFPSSLIVWHVTVTLLGYLAFIASFVAAALYLLQERNLRRKKWGPIYYKLPSLETLDLWSGWFVYVGFPLLTIGAAAGSVFAHLTWSTFWQADPKVIFTFLVWLVYGGYLLLRTVVGWGGRKAAWWSVAGVVALMINYFVMNLLSGLHRFA